MLTQLIIKLFASIKYINDAKAYFYRCTNYKDYKDYCIFKRRGRRELLQSYCSYGIAGNQQRVYARQQTIRTKADCDEIALSINAKCSIYTKHTYIKHMYKKYYSRRTAYAKNKERPLRLFLTERYLFNVITHYLPKL